MSGLTDEERELKRLAEEVVAMGYANMQANPATVLRLLARIEELEGRPAAPDPLGPIPKGDVDRLIAHLERAEEVAFEMAAKAVEAAPASFNRNDVAERIRGLKAKRTK